MDDELINIDVVAELLQSWGMPPEIQAAFSDNKMDGTCLEHMTEADIRELIPTLKERILFRKHLTEYRRQNGALSKVCSFDDIICSDVTDTDPGEASEACSLNSDAKSNITSISVGSEADSKIKLNRNQIDLISILKDTTNGEICILSLNKTLDTSTRNLLTKAVVDYYIKKYSCINSEDFNNLACEIVKLYPNESKETYYIPSTKYAKGQYIPDRGKLVDRYHNQRRILRKSGLIPSLRKPDVSAEAKEDQSRAGIAAPSTITTEEAKECQIWLKYNKEPWAEIVEKWSLTRVFRTEATTVGTIHDIIEEWPSLKQSLGYKLIEIDFNYMYPNKEITLFKKWVQFIEKADSIFKKKNVAAFDVLKDNPQEDARDCMYFKLLSEVLPPTSRVCIKDASKKKAFYKPSIAESKRAFILHVKNQSEILSQLQLRQKEHQAKGLTCQPLVITVGPTDCQLTDYYVGFDDVLYKIDSLLKAVDVCFKLVHVLNAKYPLEAENVWIFIQKYFYNIHLKTDRKIASVACLISELA